jgi:hypothetical protein
MSPPRRQVLVGAGLLGAGIVGYRASDVAAAGPDIRPRSDWGADLPPVGPLPVEAPGDVRFLLVHHTVSPNEYGPGEVRSTIRSIYGMHTSAEKGWPDVAYNFFVDRHGTIWEARQGSIAAPVMGSATGGSQGHAMLCCFLGTHTEVAPTAAAQDAMVTLLAWLGVTYGIDLTPGATATFTSRGSNLHPAGTTVTTPTIAGHRDMSSTACPGDAAYRLVTDEFPARAAALVAASVTSTTASTTTTTVPTTTSTTPTTSTVETAAPEVDMGDDEGDDAAVPTAAAGGAAALVAGAGVWWWRRRRAVDADGVASHE